MAAADIDGDGAADLINGAFTASEGASYAGRVDILPGAFTHDDRVATLASESFSGSAEQDYCGWDLATIGDADGDGADEVGVVCVGRQSNGTSPYAVYILNRSTVSGPLGTVLTELTDEKSGDEAGGSIGGGGDPTGDGVPDLIVGAWRSSAYTNNGGAAYVMSGVAGGDAMGGAQGRLYGDSAMYFGSVVNPIGDHNGDGVDDLAVGALGYTDATLGMVGAVFVFDGPVSGVSLASAADALVAGHEAQVEFAGQKAVLLGSDLDADGYSDLVAGAANATSGADRYAGALYVMSGSSLSGSTGVFFATGSVVGGEEDMLGGTAAAVGDANGDGLGDLAVGAVGDSTYGDDSGAIFLLPGAIAGTHTKTDAVASWLGGDRQSGVGYALVGGVDLTSDGIADLALGAAGSDGDDDGTGVIFVIPAGGY